MTAKLIEIKETPKIQPNGARLYRSRWGSVCMLLENGTYICLVPSWSSDYHPGQLLDKDDYKIDSPITSPVTMQFTP